MKLPFELIRPLATFDLETTGVNPAIDKIVSICIYKVFPDGHTTLKEMIIDPGIPIPKAASDVHGITDEVIANLKLQGKAPVFKEIAQSIYEELSDCDLAGYNSNIFDIPLVAEELYQAGITEEFPKPDQHCLDSCVIFKKKEERTLSAASIFYLDEELEGAHGATADTIAALKVLAVQAGGYDELKGKTVAEIAEFCKQGDKVDLAGKMVRREEDKKIIFTFGKYKDKLVYNAFRDDKSYYDFLMRSDFTSNTKMHFKRLKELIPAK